MSIIVMFFTTLGVCALSAVVPFVNAELYLITASAMSPRGYVGALIVAGALGQMLGKSLMYWAGVGALVLPGERLRRMVATVEERYRGAGAGGATLGGGIIMLSATMGLPPFYVVSIACGLLRIPFAQFFLLGLLGRLVRFGVMVTAPHLVKALAVWWG